MLNISPDAFATEARVVTQVVHAGSDVHRAMSVSRHSTISAGHELRDLVAKGGKPDPDALAKLRKVRHSPARHANSGLKLIRQKLFGAPEELVARRGELPGYVYVTNQPRFKYQECGLCRRYRIDSPEGWDSPQGWPMRGFA